jgi:signal transduction histidine kinase
MKTVPDALFIKMAPPSGWFPENDNVTGRNQHKAASRGLFRLILFLCEHLRAGIGRVIADHRPRRRRRTLNLSASTLPQSASRRSVRVGILRNWRAQHRAARMRGSRRLIAALTLILVNVAAADETKQLLVLYSSNRLLPGNIALDAGLHEAIPSSRTQSIHIFSEFLDEPEFGGDKYELALSTYLREKYAARPPDAVLLVGDTTLGFMLRFRDRLFPSVPMVYEAVTQATIQSTPNLPPDIVGVPITYDIAGTAKLALQLHPHATHLVIVAGVSNTDAFSTLQRPEVTLGLGNVKTEYLVGLAVPALQRRLRALTSDSVVLTFGFFRDGDGHTYVPHDSAVLIAAASAAPVYSPFETFMGTGVVGGRMLSFEQMGRQGGQIVEHLFDGDPDWRRVPPAQASVTQVDWRQIERWKIDPKLLPQNTIIAFRTPTLWQAYRNLAIVVGLIIVLQSALVASLLLERRRRRTAELAVQRQHAALAHASRLAVAGELTAAIAHEINQPLGAVQTNADTVEVILQAGGDRREDLLRLVGRIRNDNLRASEVIRRLRTLLAKQEARRQPLDLNVILTDVEIFLRPELQRRQLSLVLRLAANPARILGDEIQIQQIVINLLLNAMEALADAEPGRRSILVQVECGAEYHSIFVKDQGPGFADSDLSKLFDSFFSTKQTGMGLGLSIARTIVEAHAGTIGAEHNPAGGAIFHVRLPAYNEPETPA